MAGLKRYTAVLRLFSETHSVWTVQKMADALSVPQSTVYRTVRDLVDQNFLEAAGEARYRLGSVFIEFDRLLRLTDPFVKTGERVLRDLVEEADVPCVGLLCRLYNDTVMCVADVSNGATFRTSYERGRPMPLTSGATSKAILAHLPARRLARLLDAVGASHSDAFRKELSGIRKRGVCITHSEIDADVLGIAAPVFPRAPGSLASLSLVLPLKYREDTLLDRLAAATIAGARRMEAFMADEGAERETSGDSPRA